MEYLFVKQTTMYECLCPSISINIRILHSRKLAYAFLCFYSARSPVFPLKIPFFQSIIFRISPFRINFTFSRWKIVWPCVTITDELQREREREREREKTIESFQRNNQLIFHSIRFFFSRGEFFFWILHGSTYIINKRKNTKFRIEVGEVVLPASFFSSSCICVPCVQYCTHWWWWWWWSLIVHCQTFCRYTVTHRSHCIYCICARIAQNDEPMLEHCVWTLIGNVLAFIIDRFIYLFIFWHFLQRNNLL